MVWRELKRLSGGFKAEGWNDKAVYAYPWWILRCLRRCYEAYKKENRWKPSLFLLISFKFNGKWIFNLKRQHSFPRKHILWMFRTKRLVRCSSSFIDVQNKWVFTWLVFERRTLRQKIMKFNSQRTHHPQISFCHRRDFHFITIKIHYYEKRVQWISSKTSHYARKTRIYRNHWWSRSN